MQKLKLHLAALHGSHEAQTQAPCALQFHNFQAVHLLPIFGTFPWDFALACF